jgi:hypothetical protein
MQRQLTVTLDLHILAHLSWFVCRSADIILPLISLIAHLCCLDKYTPDHFTGLAVVQQLKQGMSDSS